MLLLEIAVIRKREKDYLKIHQSRRYKQIRFFNTKNLKKRKLYVSKPSLKRRKLKTNKSFKAEMYYTFLFRRARNLTLFRKYLTHKRPFSYEKTRDMRGSRLSVARMVLGAKRANMYHILMPSAPYMELSYRIFSIILFRIPHRTLDTNLSTSLQLINRFGRNVELDFKQLILPRPVLKQRI